MSNKYLNFFFVKVSSLSIVLLILIFTLCLIGLGMQYSAGGGNFYQYAFSYLIKTILGFIVLFIAFRVDLKIIFLLTDYFYYFSLFLLFVVEILGDIRLGAQRWLDLGLFVIQPSEIMKISLILMLAKYFHGLSSLQLGRFKFYLMPAVIAAIPFLLILKQPDLGTAMMIALITISLFFLSGFRLKYFVIMGVTLLMTLPIAWFSLHNYQKERILNFLNPDRDPLGSGYHIIQSKIAIGSGEFTGKGFLQGTQAQLDFLPEKHTDFIFTLFSEEFGFIGGVLLIMLYAATIITILLMSYRCSYAYGRYIIAGIGTMLFIYVFINIGMVSGILPVVGIPLPLISFGGTSMITLMTGFGLILNIENHKNYA
ncbi:MAG: rod shape-determining protein RodA [Alphaproteobacteria bacterium]|jgi:rod shape determining protein RodA|nr:rod shape-determining protein RodA [Alphaproteobacteria bacterium]